MTRLIVDAPTPDPRQFGLYSVSTPLTAEPHALMGIEFEKNDNCTFTDTAITSSWCADTSAKAKREAYAGTSTFDSFNLYALEECASPGGALYAKAQADAVKKFNYGEERGVEARLAAMLAADATTVDVSPTTPENLVETVAILEEWLDDNYAGVGTIFGTREAGSLLATRWAIIRRGNKMQTELGTNFVASGQFGAGPSSAGTGNTWLIATGVVNVRRGPMRASDPYFVPTAGVNEVQSLAITGVPTGGTYTLSFAGETTTAIAYNATNTTIQNALIALNAFNTGDVVVTGASPTFTITYGGQYATMNVPQMTVTPALTGGTTPSAAITTTTGGNSPSGDNSFQVLVERGFVLSYDCAIAAAKAVTTAP